MPTLTLLQFLAVAPALLATVSRNLRSIDELAQIVRFGTRETKGSP